MYIFSRAGWPAAKLYDHFVERQRFMVGPQRFFLPGETAGFHAHSPHHHPPPPPPGMIEGVGET